MCPTLQPMFFAETVRQHPTTGRVTIADIFDTVVVRPGSDYTEGATIFFALRNVHGEARMTLACVDLAEDEVLLERPVRVTAESLETTDVTVLVNRFPVPHEGTYAWELIYGDETIASARFEAVYSRPEGN